MGRYILKRILVSIPVIIGITIITFYLLNVVPRGSSSADDEGTYKS